MLPEQPGNNNEPLHIDYHKIKKAAIILRALNHKLRQQIIRLIDENKLLTVSEIHARLMLEQPVASQHLAILRRTGILSTKRKGKFIYYSIDHTRVSAIEEFVKSLVG